MRHFSTVLLLATAVSAFGATLGVPVAGYVTFADGSELRAIFGSPGSYQFSQPLPLPAGATRVYPAPARDFGFVQRAPSDDAAETSLALVTFADGRIDKSTALDGAIGSPDGIVFSPEGGSAVLFLASGRVQVWSGLPESPQLTTDLADGAIPEAAVTAAVSENGEVLLVASSRALYLVPATGTARLVLAAGRIASVVMLRNGRDAAVADNGAGAIHLLRGLAGDPVVSVLTSGFEDLGAIYPASDARSLYVASPSLNSIAAVDLGSGAVETFTTGAPPLRLTRLRNRDTFLLSAVPGEPGWVFFHDDAAIEMPSADRGKTVFIPAIPAVQEGQQ